MKQFRFLQSLMTLALGGAILFLSACGEDAPPPVPTLTFIAETDGYEVTLTMESTDATEFAWDYGDGNTSTQSNASHVYTYEASGDYTISVTATGAGGDVTKSTNVTIVASLFELLAGPPSGSGKSWKLSNADPVAITAINVDFTPPYQPVIPTNALGFFQTDIDAEYDNEFTFKPDGSIDMSGKNGAILTGTLFTELTNAGGGSLQYLYGAASASAAGMAGVSFTDASGKFELHEDADLSVNTVNNEFDSETVPLVATKVDFTGVDYLSFSDGGFFGLRDFTTDVIIKSIANTGDKITVIFFLSTFADPTTTEQQALMTNASLALEASYVLVQ